MKSNFLNKFQKTLIIFLLILIGVFIIFFTEIEASDELWNLQNTLKMVNGFLIYKDANVITTPIFFYIGFIFLKIFGTTLFSFRIYNLVIYFFLLFMVYKIFLKLKFSKHIASLCTILIFIQILSIITSGANYSALAIVFALIGIYLYLSKNYNVFLHSLIIFLVFFTKQNIGVLYGIAIVVCDLYLNKFTKTFLINLIKKFIIFCILSLLILIPMYFNNTLGDFINYAFGGMIEFGTKNLNIDITPYLIIVTLLPFLLYFIIYKQKNNFLQKVITDDIFEKFTILIIFTFFLSFILYPIINTAHLLFVLPLHLISIFYVLDVLILEDFFSEAKFILTINWLSIVLLITIVIRIIFHYFFIEATHSFVTDKSSTYYGFMIKTETLNEINNIKNYIISKNNEGIDVINTSCESAFTMIELKQSHGVYDLLFNGNLGYNGIENLKKDILKRKNTEFLVLTDENKLSYQESPELRNFIIENLTFVGYIEKYSIYANY